MPLYNPPGGGGSGTVTSVAATDTSIVVSGTPTTTPTLATATLDVIASDHPPAAAVGMNSQKITSLANGSASSDGAAFGQIPVVDSTAAHIQALAASAAAGSNGKWADSGHAHPNTGVVTSVAATDTSVVVGGTSAAPTVATGTLDVIATQHPPAGNWSNNSQKITSLANGSGAQDAAAYGQTLAGGSGSPLTTKGDLLYENATPAPARLAIGTVAGSTGDFLGVSGGIPAWQQVSGQYLCTPTQYAPASQVTFTVTSTTFVPITPAATTVAAGSNGGEISQVASWSSPSAGVLDVATTTGWPASGTVTVAASGSTTAIVTFTGTAAGQLTGCAYVSGSATGTVSTGGAVTLVSSVANTGSFTAPASGSAVVTATFQAAISTASDYCAFGLCAHATTTPMVGFTAVLRPTTGNLTTYCLSFLVTGLTAGNPYNFDLMAAVQSTINLFIIAIGATSTSPTLTSGGQGSPVTMTVQAV
jgi:hypothetical protein